MAKRYELTKIILEFAHNEKKKNPNKKATKYHPKLLNFLSDPFSVNVPTVFDDWIS